MANNDVKTIRVSTATWERLGAYSGTLGWKTTMDTAINKLLDYHSAAERDKLPVHVWVRESDGGIEEEAEITADECENQTALEALLEDIDDQDNGEWGEDGFNYLKNGLTYTIRRK